MARRKDGRLIKSASPLFKIIPMIMRERSDAQVYAKRDFDLEIIEKYCRKKYNEQGMRISKMAVIMAGMVRVYSQMPEMNRFIVNSRVYARNDIMMSFAMLKSEGGASEETTIKLRFEPTDTVFDVSRRLDEAIAANSVSTYSNSTDKLLGALMSLPVIPKLATRFLMSLDNCGLLPKAVLDASPFHVSMWITNMASIKMEDVYHHIYNFGTASEFMALGKPYNKVIASRDGKISTMRCLPIASVIDERICDGDAYAHAFAMLEKLLKQPELLETPPERVNRDID